MRGAPLYLVVQSAIVEIGKPAAAAKHIAAWSFLVEDAAPLRRWRETGKRRHISKS